MTEMTAINVTLTVAGLRAVFAAANDGLSAKITHIALGTSKYTPSGSETALKSEKARVEVAGGRYVDDYNIEISALLDTNTGFTVAEVGLILEDGTLLGVWSDPNMPLAAYTVGVPIAFGCRLGITQLPADSLTFSGDIDLQLFYDADFARLAAMMIANARHHQEALDRIKELEVLPSRLALQAARIDSVQDQIKGLVMQIDDLKDQIETLSAT
ncbi:phage tail protein [uncultured Cohaesibacter sp.]|uniref:phage tail-collar fiber domain-containing protein n=1 Tax=uncultured Cohaesibacter sp. TaxID=1002546 RepID=UPI002AAAFF74|nr:phage tail protein [uncultured Cohaesibacter sp.]